MINFEQFLPFFGVIEDVNDPEEIGRVRVRAHGFHTDNPGLLPTEELPWLSSIVSNSGSYNGAGISPTGYLVGTTVFGFFLDRSLQVGVVLGALVGKTNAVSDVSNLAVGGAHHPIADIRERNRVKEVQGPLENTEETEDEQELKQKRWGEPAYINNASYPHNHVFETQTGLIREMDGTPGNERIHEYHPSGSYYEVAADGTRVVKVVGDGYEIIAGAKFINIRGNVQETIDGNYNLYVKGNMTMQVDGNLTEVVQGNKQEFANDLSSQASGTRTETSGELVSTAGTIAMRAGRILLNEG